MPELSFLLPRLEKSWNLPIRVWDKDRKIIYITGDVPQVDEPEMSRRVTEGFGELPNVPVVHMGTDGIYGILFRDEEDRIFYLGPAVANGLTFQQQIEFRRRHSIRNFQVAIPKISLAEALNDVILLFGIITGREVTESEIMKASGMDGSHYLDHSHVLQYEMRAESREQQHLSYREEQRWLSNIENGTVKREKDYLNAENMAKLDQVGILSSENTLKQFEYLAVTSTVLACRAAIRGGVSAYDAYHMSELYLQKISRCRDTMELLEIQQNVAQDFSDQVRKVKENKGSDCVEQCKNYLARHRKEKFSLTAVAEAVGRSPGYLSRIFSEETGQTMQEYALERKLDAAANLLIHSQETIGDIAEYLNFSSQSYFGERFKAQYGMTPAAYRREHRIQDF